MSIAHSILRDFSSNAPYAFWDNSGLQNCYLKSIGLTLASNTTTGGIVKFYIGTCYGACAKYVDISKPLIPAFEITLANGDYTEYKLDGTDPNVSIHPEVLKDNKVYVGKDQILLFCEKGATNQFGFCNKNAYPDIQENPQYFVGTSG